MSFGRHLFGSAVGIISGLAVVTILDRQTGNILRAKDNQEIFLAIIMLAVVMTLMRKRR